MKHIVTEKARRPAIDRQECAFCHQPLGTEHRPDCVLTKKKIKIRMIVEYETDCPASWGKEDIEFHRNESSWCADYALVELELFADEHCLCDFALFEYIQDVSGEFLDEC